MLLLTLEMLVQLNEGKQAYSIPVYLYCYL